MTVTNIEQEILDWFNEPEEQEHRKETSIGTSVWWEFLDALRTKDAADKYGYKTAMLASGPAYVVENVGGEGQGEIRYVVFQVGDQFFQVDGYYASWDGTTWEDPTPYEVEAKEVVVIKYEQKVN
jgi:hypothetical protein